VSTAAWALALVLLLALFQGALASHERARSDLRRTSFNEPWEPLARAHRSHNDQPAAYPTGPRFSRSASPTPTVPHGDRHVPPSPTESAASTASIPSTIGYAEPQTGELRDLLSNHYWQPYSFFPLSARVHTAPEPIEYEYGELECTDRQPFRTDIWYGSLRPGVPSLVAARLGQLIELLNTTPYITRRGSRSAYLSEIRDRLPDAYPGHTAASVRAAKKVLIAISADRALGPVDDVPPNHPEANEIPLRSDLRMLLLGCNLDIPLNPRHYKILRQRTHRMLTVHVATPRVSTRVPPPTSACPNTTTYSPTPRRSMLPGKTTSQLRLLIVAA
jgi:hypothetical protein